MSSRFESDLQKLQKIVKAHLFKWRGGEEWIKNEVEEENTYEIANKLYR